VYRIHTRDIRKDHQMLNQKGKLTINSQAKLIKPHLCTSKGTKRMVEMKRSEVLFKYKNPHVANVISTSSNGITRHLYTK
jgi:hypothetical protein